MPRGENFWNPYRWVPASTQPVQRAAPLYHHRWQGLAGRLHCRLTALTPFLINDGTGAFIRSRRTQQPFIPATSLKGAMRSLAELVGNAAVPFPKGPIDPGHQLSQASEGDGPTCKLDIVARTFGYLDSGEVCAGLLRFSDGILEGKPPQPLSCKVAVGQPKPEHQPFYPGPGQRKLYHHRVGATSLTPPHPGITQTSTVRPLPSGVTFHFSVDFANLRDEELDLLLYCLGLEEDVSVTLSKEATGGEAVSLRGPMRHKMGHCKPHGGGSVHMRIERMELRSDPAARYRGPAASPAVCEGDELRAWLVERSRSYCQRMDPTMQHLRAMLIYTAEDPRAKDDAINYPTYHWFQDDKNEGLHRPLKPTL